MKFTPHVPTLPFQRGALWRRVLVLTLLCVALAALASSETLHGALLELLAVCQQTIMEHPTAGMLLFVGFAAFSAMLAFVSIAMIVPVAVYTWGEPLSMALLWGGWILGGLSAYTVGRFLGRPIVAWLTAEAGIRHLERYIDRDTPFLPVLLFQLALPSEIPGYVLGLTRYHPTRYLLSLGVAELPYALLTVHLGAGFVERRSSIVLTAGLLSIGLSIAAFALLRKRLSNTKPTGQE